MENSNDILQELREISPVIAGIQKVNVFTVPMGYFTSLSDDILASLKEEGIGLPGMASHPVSYEVPAGYFDDLATTILSRIKAQQNEQAADELKALSPLLFSLQHKNIIIKNISNKTVVNYNIDLKDARATKKVFEENKDIKGIIHFAAFKAVGESVEKPLMSLFSSNTFLVALASFKSML